MDQFFIPRHGRNPFEEASGRPSRRRCWITGFGVAGRAIDLGITLPQQRPPFPGTRAASSRCANAPAAAAVASAPDGAQHGSALRIFPSYTEAGQTRNGMIPPEAMLASLSDRFPSFGGG